MPLLVTGLFKKTIGDQLAPFANAAFDHPAQQTALGLWIGALAFTFQILCDFSGYTDLALGSAGLLGYRLPSNFNWPYRATSIQDFWRRWHMTLARWFRDYIYIPLGGSQRGEARYYFAMFVTWLTTGLWHGAGLTFIVWGLWNGCGLVVVRIWRRGIGSRHPMPTGLAWAITFLFVVFGWVFFRSALIGEALSYIAGMLGAADGSLLAPLLVAVVLGVAVIAQWSRLQVAVTTLAPAGSLRRYAAYGTLFAAATTMLPGFTPDFIYFQF
jgi:D-alanyl-lipoteichoic acid acyltransferase DltB (MBOAT superfamily)